MPDVRFAAPALVAALMLGALGPAAAFDPPAWRVYTRDTGTTFYQCEVPATCGDVLASHHVQEPGLYADAAAYERVIRARAASHRAYYSTRFDGKARQYRAGGFRVFLIAATTTSGTEPRRPIIYGFMSDGRTAYTVVSSGADGRMAARFHAELVARLAARVAGPRV